MKLKPACLSIGIVLITLALNSFTTLHAQQYKLKQATTMVGMKSESTIYVKGMRKRTEGGGMMGMGNQVSIEQCDLQRTIKINDRKKLYYIEPFVTEEEMNEKQEEAIAKAAAYNSKQAAGKPEKGGIIYMYYNITDTGERKKMHGLTARHVWTTQKIKPSANACMMKDSMIIKTDGWYIDLPQFNCPVHYSGMSKQASYKSQPVQCQDRYVSRRSGKGKLGFPLIEKKTMIMGNGMGKTTEMETTLETLEFSMMKLDSMLFEIPVGYTETKNEEDLQDQFDAAEYMKQAAASMPSREKTAVTEEKRPGVTRIGVFEPKGEDQLDAGALQEHIVASLADRNVEAVAISSEADAKRYNCDLLLKTEFRKMKSGSRIGGLLKAIKNTDPTATSSFSIGLGMVLLQVSDNSVRLEKKVDGRFEGKADAAAQRALEKACDELIGDLEQ